MRWGQTPRLWPTAAAVGLACCLLCGPGGAAPNRAGAEGIEVMLHRVEGVAFPQVSAFVAVTDERGASLTGLSSADFMVTDNGQPVKDLSALSVLSDGASIAVVLLVDRSGSMRGEPSAEAAAAARDFASRMSQGDRLAVLTFAGTVGEVPEPTRDHALALAPLDDARVGGNTALYDAVVRAAEALAQQDADRRAVIVFSDGRDTASRATLADCLEAASAADVALHCVALGHPVAADVLSALADGSGGVLLHAAEAADMRHVYRAVTEQLTNEYVLTYSAPEAALDDIWHTVAVSVRDSAREAADARQYLRPQTEWMAAWRGVSGLAPVTATVGGLIVLNLGLVTAFAVRGRRRRCGR